MSIFSLPRIHVSGLIEINVGTANNDDYSGFVFQSGPGADQPVRLANTAAVQPMTFGQSDAAFIAWVQSVVNAVKPPSAPTGMAAPAAVTARASAPAFHLDKGLTPPPALAEVTQLIPVEWNYYGDMGLKMVDVIVTAVNYGDRLVTNRDPTAAADPFIGATLSFNNRADSTGRTTGIICDVTPEDVPLSQILAGTLMLERKGSVIFSGSPHKANTRWINFQRNVNLTASAGASAVFQHAVPLSSLSGQPILSALPATDPGGRPLAGLVFRYALFRTLPSISPKRYATADAYNAAILALYATQGTNPGVAQVAGTIAPWYQGDMATLPAGRYLIPTSNVIKPPPNTRGNGPVFQLAPATLEVDATRQGGPVVTVDTAGCFPECYQGNFDPYEVGKNTKYDFGAATLTLQGATKDYKLGTIPYTTPQYAARDGIFEFPLGGIPASDITTGTFNIAGPAGDLLLSETEYLVVSDQSGVYAEEEPAPTTIDRFNNEGDSVPVTFRVFQRGVEVTGNTLKLAVWEYNTTPNQDPGPLTRVQPDLAPGDPLTITVTTPGNRVYTVTLPGQSAPPASYGSLPLMTAPLVCMRILPNADYSAYFDDSQAEPVGTAALDFNVIYKEVLRNYYLLYPAMSQQVPLNDPSYWQDPVMATTLLNRVDFSQWMHPTYMPRTRDLSGSRRKLIQAWCRKIIGTVILAALGTLAMPTRSSAQIPYQLVVQPSPKQAAPGLQSFSLGQHDGVWLLIGGRRNGFHRTSARESTFPSRYANDSVYAINPITGDRWSMPLPAALRDRLRVSNAASLDDNGILYILGGYGSTCDDDKPTCYQTFPSLTAINVQQGIAAVRANNQIRFASFIATLDDPRMRVAGGALRRLGSDFYLLFGQNYDAIYKGGYTGAYTEQIRRFTIKLGGAIVNQPGRSTISVGSYQAYDDPISAGASSEYHRRDLNVTEAVHPGGRLGLSVFGGVFTPRGLSWVHPIFVDPTPASAAPSIVVIKGFTQKMSAYDCARALFYDPARKVMYISLLGGISLYYYDSTGTIHGSSPANSMPFINSITTIAQDNIGAFNEVTQSVSMSLPKLLGANAEFVPLPTLARIQGTHDVIDLSRLPTGPRVLVGHLYGGIVATASQASEFNPTFANDTLYDVLLVRGVRSPGNSSR